MTAFLLISILVPVLIGFTLVSILWPGRLRSHLLIKSSLSVGAGFGIFSLLFFLSLLLLGASRSGLLAAEIVLLISLVAILGYRMKTRKGDEENLDAGPGRGSRLGRILSIVFLLAISSSIAAFVFVSLKKPHGDWDAWAVHNMRARFIFRAGEQWRDAYSDHLAWSSLDYPLMISGSIAGCWRVIGNDTVLVPIILGMLFTFATVGLATSSLAALRTRSQGYMAGIILLCTPLLITHGASQYLDIPSGYFFLATIVLLNLQSRFSEKESWLLPLAGFTAGLSAWTKNEGILFIIVVLAARFITIVPREGLKTYLKQTLRMAAGLLPVLVVLVYFKMRLATPALLLASGEQSAIEKLVDLSRYSQIFDAFKNQALGFGGWPVSVLLLLVFYILLLGVKVDQRERSSVLASALILALMMLGYFFIFVITPRELAWHLASTLDRLFVQLFPSFVFLCFMIARAPEQAIEEKLQPDPAS